MISTKSFLKSSFLYGINNSAMMISGFIFLPIYGKYLSNYDFGIIESRILQNKITHPHSPINKLNQRNQKIRREKSKEDAEKKKDKKIKKKK